MIAKRGALLVVALLSCGEESGGLIGVPVSGRFDPPAIDFGEVAVRGSRSIEVQLINTGELTLSHLIATAPDDGTFVIDPADLIVPPGQQRAVAVTFAPARIGPSSAALSLAMSGEEQIPIAVRGSGILAPIFSIAPEALDFGTLELGQEALGRLSIANVGSAPGTVESWSVAPGSPFAVTTAMPLMVPEQGEVEIEIAYRPASSGTHADRVSFATNAEAIGADLSGSVAIGALVCTPELVELGDVLRGGVSTGRVDCTSTGAIRFLAAELSGSALFALDDPPNEADLDAGEALALSISFSADGPQSDHEAALLVRYRNAEGDQSLEIPLRARVLAPAPADTALSLFLFWDTDLTDMDLHLVAPGGSAFGVGTDCYFQQPSPDWGTPGDPSDDPFLDQDDLDGFGPENINLASAAPGDYQVLAHYYADNRIGPSIASVELHAGGALVGVFERSLACDDLWHVGTIQWDGSRATFVASDEVVASDRGLCF